MIVYTDGASRGNPGKSAYGFVVYDHEGRQIYKEGSFIGIATNNIAEYTAVIRAFEFIKDNLTEVTEIEVMADSNLVVQQLSGKFKVKALHLKPLINNIRELEKNFTKATYRHIRRNFNKEADSLANMALDKIN